MGYFRITIASLPDRERLVAEILFENVQFAEISYETDEPVIQFYAHPHKDHWEFPCEEALQVLEEAKNRLLEL